MPLLRYRTGDIASLTREPCVCGRTFARMSAVRGRRDDMLIVRGVNLYPSQIEHVLLRVEGIAPHYQLVVERPETPRRDHRPLRADRRGRGPRRARARARSARRSASAWPSRCSSPAPCPAARARRSGSSISARRCTGSSVGRLALSPSPRRDAARAPDQPRREVLARPTPRARSACAGRAGRRYATVQPASAPSRPERLGGGERDPPVALGVRVQAVDVPQPPVGGDRHAPRGRRPSRRARPRGRGSSRSGAGRGTRRDWRADSPARGRET